MSLIIGVVFLNQDLNQPGIMNLNGAFFLVIVNLSFGNLFPVLNVFCSGQTINQSINQQIKKGRKRKKIKKFASEKLKLTKPQIVLQRLNI